MEDGRGSSGIGSGKSIGLAEGILLPAEAVESNRSRPYIHPAVRALKVSFLSAFFVARSPLAKLPWRRKLFTVLLVIRQDKVCFEICPIQLFFIMIVDVGTILFQLKSTVIASIEYLY